MGANGLSNHYHGNHDQAGRCGKDDADAFGALHECVRVSFSMLSDGTMANEVELCHTLLQWPYLTDMSLVSALVSIFVPTWCRQVAREGAQSVPPKPMRIEFEFKI